MNQIPTVEFEPDGVNNWHIYIRVNGEKVWLQCYDKKSHCEQWIDGWMRYRQMFGGAD